MLCHALVLGFSLNGFAKDREPYYPVINDTVPKTDTVTRKGINKYLNIITDRAARDSILVKMSRANAEEPVADSIIRRQRENNFIPYGGKVIRSIYYNQLKVFGTVIEDTSYTASMKLLRLVNSLHTDTYEWVLRQSLFFRENDTVNAYKMVENERYLRNLPFIQDARLYVINAYQDPDSIDVVVLTKDLFEYGGSIDQASDKSFGATIYNKNLLGAGQQVLFGFNWTKDYHPEWFSQLSYSKYNVSGTFADVSVGYSTISNRVTADTGQYERSYYLTVNRPLYSAWAKFTGGLTLAKNSSMNVGMRPDTTFRNYSYRILDVWAGYNFSNQFKGSGINSNKPNLAFEMRHYNLSFLNYPDQPYLAKDPIYNDHYYTLGKFVLFHQDFLKTNYFFGFGRTEDIPTGYNASIGGGYETWVDRNRVYTSVEGQKYWLGKNQGLLSTVVQVGSFWKSRKSEDAVIHGQINYYSRLFRPGQEKFREILQLDYLYCPNPVFYKPLNINRENGIQGYRNTYINGYQRMNMGAETVYYSRLKIYGFKFNFLAIFQGSLLTNYDQAIFTSPFYSAMGLGCLIRNENLTFNTVQMTALYMPIVPAGTNHLFFQVTTIADIRFNIFALTEPALIPFK